MVKVFRRKSDQAPQQTSPNPPKPTNVRGQRSDVAAIRTDAREMKKSRRAAQALTVVPPSQADAPKSNPGWWTRVLGAVFGGADYTAASQAASMREDIGVGVGYNAFGYAIDPDDHLYRRISQAQRELPPIIQDRALRLSWSLYESNPLAHGIIEMEKDYVVGKGFSYHATDENVQKVLDKHWNDSINNWDIKQHDKVRDLCLYGEALYLAFTNEATGHVRLASVDPIMIRAVFTEPDNPEVVNTIVTNPRRKGGTLSEADRFYRVIHEDEDPNSSTFGKLVGAGKSDTFTPIGSNKKYPYSGSCFYFTINSVTGAVRGRSDLLSVIDWLDAYDQILFNFVDRTLLMNSFVWDVTIQDATASQLGEWRRTHSMAPKSGTVNVHNQNEKWEAVSPTFARAEFEVQQKTLKAQILAAVGMPPHWFGEQEANRATAIEQNSPALKRLESRQLYIQYMMKSIFQYQVDQAIVAGALPAESESDPYQFEVSAPRMGSKDLSQASTSMLAVTQALTIALTGGIVDLVEARRIFVELSAELGADISYEEMVDRMGDDWSKFYSDSMQPLEPNAIPGGGGQADPASKPKAPVTGTPVASTTRQPRRPAVSESGPDNPYQPRTILEAIGVLRDAGFGVALSVKTEEPEVEVEAAV